MGEEGKAVKAKGSMKLRGRELERKMRGRGELRGEKRLVDIWVMRAGETSTKGKRGMSGESEGTGSGFLLFRDYMMVQRGLEGKSNDTVRD